MENGDCDASDIIASVKKGIYVDEFSNGQVQIGEGDFTFYVNSGFLIEDGRLTAPVKDINVIGNGPEALADITHLDLRKRAVRAGVSRYPHHTCQGIDSRRGIIRSCLDQYFCPKTSK